MIWISALRKETPESQLRPSSKDTMKNLEESPHPTTDTLTLNFQTLEL